MERKFKRILSAIMCAVMLLAVFPTGAFAAERNAVDSGFCGADGENLTWTLYDDGELVISGEGDMANYHYFYIDPPWEEYFPQIKVITVEEGVTSIGYYAFVVATTLYYRVNLPKSIKSIAGPTVDTDLDGHCLAVCYAGSEEDWAEVEHRHYDIGVKYEGDGTWFEEAYTGSCYGEDLTKAIVDCCIKMYFNGEEPPIFCEVFCFQAGDRWPDDEVDVYVHFYLGETEAEKVLIYGRFGDSDEFFIGEREVGKTTKATVTIPPADYGEFYVRAELIDTDGKIVAASEDCLLENDAIPEPEVDPTEGMTFFEKIKYTFNLFVAEIAWGIYVMNILFYLIGMSF